MKINRNNSLYLFGICIFTFSELLGKTVLYEYNVTSIICDIMRYAIAFPIVLIVFFVDKKISYRTFLISICAIIIIALNIFFAKEKRLILIALYVIAGRNIKLEQIIKVAFITIAFVFTATIVLNMLGILENVVYIQQHGTRVRNSLGFKYSSYSGNLLLHLTCMYIFLKKDKFSILHGAIIFALSGIIYYLTDTNFAFACTVLAVSSTLIINYCRWFKVFDSIFWILERNVCLISMFLSIAITIMYTFNKPFLEQLNLILNQRLRLGSVAIYKYGIHLFGNYFDLIGPVEILNDNSLVYNYVDSSYVQILLKYGILFLILLVCIISRFCKNIFNVKEYYLAIAMIVILLHSMLEPQLLDIGYNPFLFGMGIAFKKNAYSNIHPKRKFPLRKHGIYSI